MATQDIENLPTLLREIKQDLRAIMNGPVSQSMRQKGLRYKVIFGVELPRLQAFAEELPHTYALAAALWKEDIRECRLLAGMLMPRDAFPEDLAEVWMAQMHFTEEVDVTIFHLLQYEPYASKKVFEWLADERLLQRYAGYQLLQRLFIQGMRLTTRDAQEFLDHVNTDLHDAAAREVQLVAYKALLRFMDQGIPEERLGKKVLDTLS